MKHTRWIWLFLFCTSTPLLAALEAQSLMLDAKQQVKIKKVASVKEVGNVELLLGPLPEEDLAAGEFRVEDLDGDSFGGAFSVDSKGKVAFTANEAFLDYLAQKITAAVEEVHDDFDPNTITGLEITKEKLEAKGSKKFLFQTKVRVEFSLSLGGQVQEPRMDFALQGKGALPDETQDPVSSELQGSSWLISGKLTGNVKIDVQGAPVKVPKLNEKIKDSFDEVEFVFGPIPAEDILENEFSVENAGEETFSGTFTVDSKGKKITFEQDNEKLQEQVQAMFDEVTIPAGTPIDIGTLTIDITVSNVKTSGTHKPGKSLNYKTSFKFEATVDVLDLTVNLTGNYTYTAKGVPVS